MIVLGVFVLALSLAHACMFSDSICVRVCARLCVCLYPRAGMRGMKASAAPSHQHPTHVRAEVLLGPSHSTGWG